MNDKVTALLKRVMNGAGNEEALRHLEAAVQLLKEEMRIDAERDAIVRREAAQPFEGAHPILRDYPRPEFHYGARDENGPD